MSDITRKRAEDFERFKQYAAIALLVAAPVLIALPPRKLDIYTAGLGAAFVFSADYVATERTGKGLFSHAASCLPSNRKNPFLPTEKAEEYSVRMQLARLQEKELEKMKEVAVEDNATEESILHKIWMGNEKEGWEKRRAAEAKKAMAEGKSYFDLIKDHIREAWGADESSQEMSSKEGEKNESEEKPN